MLPSVNPSSGAGAACAFRSMPAAAQPPVPTTAQEFQVLIGHVDAAVRNADTKKGKALGDRLRSKLKSQLQIASAQDHLKLQRSCLTGLERHMRQKQVELEAAANPQPGHAIELAIIQSNQFANRIRKELGLPQVEVNPLASREKAAQRFEQTTDMALMEMHLDCIDKVVRRGDLDQMCKLRDAHIGIRTRLMAQVQAVGPFVEKRWALGAKRHLEQLTQAITKLEKGITYVQDRQPFDLDKWVMAGEPRCAQARARITEIEIQLARMGRGGVSQSSAMGLDEQILRQEVHLLDGQIAFLQTERGQRIASQQEFNTIHNPLWEATKQCWEKFRLAPENSPAEQRLGKEYHHLVTRKNTLRNFFVQKMDKIDPYKYKAAEKLKSHLARACQSLGLDPSHPLPARPGWPLSETVVQDMRRRKTYLSDALAQKWDSGTAGPEVEDMYHMLEELDAKLEYDATAVKFRDEVLPNHLSQLQTQLASQGLSQTEVKAAMVRVREPDAVPTLMVDADGFLHGPVERRSALPVVKASELPVVFPPEGLASHFGL
jgi:hypothetical protein